MTVTDSAYITGNLDVGLNQTVGGTLGVTGVFTGSAEGVFSGDLKVLDSAYVQSNLEVGGNLKVGNNKFNVVGSNGNTQIDGTLDVDGNFEVGASKFNVTASSGNTQIDGTLEVDGTAGVDGDFRVGSNKFNVTASNGNTEIDGVLAIANQDSDGINGNLETSNVAVSLFRLDSAIGNLASLSATDVSSHLNIVSAINAVAA